MRMGRSGKRGCAMAGEAKTKPAAKNLRRPSGAVFREISKITRRTYTKASPGEIAAGMAEATPARLIQPVC